MTTTKRIVLSGLLIAAALAAPAGARADEPAPVKEGTFVLSFDYLLGNYSDVSVDDGSGTGTNIMADVTQPYYLMGFRGTLYDWTKKTPLGAVPGIWFDLQIGWIGSTGEGRGFGDQGGSGLMWNTRMAGPWKILQSDNLKVGAGVGFTMGMQVGLPKETNRAMEFLAFDAFLMAVAEVKLGGFATMFEADYAVGAGYNEQRLYGHVALGKLTLGAQLVLGQAGVDYQQFGVNLGYKFTSKK